MGVTSKRSPCQKDESLRGVEGDKEKSLHRGGCTVREFPFDPVTEGRVPSSIVSRTIRLRPSSSKPIHRGTKRCLGMTAMSTLLSDTLYSLSLSLSLSLCLLPNTAYINAVRSNIEFATARAHIVFHDHDQVSDD